MDLMGAHFLAGAILTLVLPLALLCGIGLYWTILLKRRSGGDT
jgi:hypothetical protein